MSATRGVLLRLKNH